MGKVAVRGLAEAVGEIDGVQERLGNMKPVLDLVGSDLKTFVDDRFRSSTAPDGTPWAPLAPQTIKRRRQGSSKPLVDTGRLRNSITYRAQQDSVSIGTNVPYGRVHQLGGVHIPARPYLPFTAEGDFVDRGPALEELQAIEEALTAWILEGRLT